MSILAAFGAGPSNLTVPMTVAAVAGSIGVAAGVAAGALAAGLLGGGFFVAAAPGEQDEREQPPVRTKWQFMFSFSCCDDLR